MESTNSQNDYIESCNSNLCVLNYLYLNIYLIIL